MAIFNPDRTAVCTTEHLDDLPKRRRAGLQRTSVELAIEVPDRQPIRFDIELSIVRHFNRMEWIEIGDKMPAHPIRVYQFEHTSLLSHLQTFARLGGKQCRIRIDRPMKWPDRNFQIGKNPLVKIILAEQQLMDASEHGSRFCSLDDTVIVGIGDLNDLAYTKLRKRLRRHRLVFGRILDGAGGNDHRLPSHEPWHRTDSADRPWVGE